MSTDDVIKEMQEKIDNLRFEVALNEVYLKTLEQLVIELGSRLLKKDELAGVLDEVEYEKTYQAYDRLICLEKEEELYRPHTVQPHIFEFYCRMKDLERERNSWQDNKS